MKFSTLCLNAKIQISKGEPELSLGMYGVNEIRPRLQKELDADIEFNRPQTML